MRFGGGYIDGWVRVVYDGLPVTAHSNYLIKLLWQPQHVSAIIPYIFFLFLLFQLVVYQKEHRKIICLMAMCTVSMLGYSALMAIPMFISITLIMMIMILKRKILFWKDIYPFGMAFIVAVPMIKIYATPSGVSNDIQIRVRTLEQIIEIIKRTPILSIFRFFIEYGSIAVIAVIIMFYILVKRRITFVKTLLIFPIMTVMLLDIIFYTGGPNDLGMAISFVGYILLFIFALVETDTALMKNQGIASVVLICMFLGGWTNLKGIYPYRNINIPLEARQTNIMELSAWMCNNASCNESAVVFSDEVGDMNDFVPMLFHTKTLYPFHQGIQYLRGSEAQDINDYVQNYSNLSIEEKRIYFEEYKINYIIVLPDSKEVKYFEGESPLYQNGEFIVYKFLYE